MKTFYDCKTEDEKQKLRDDMLLQIVCQMQVTRNEVAAIKRCVERMEQKLVYVGATQEERKYLNIDGSLKLDVIDGMCDHILQIANVIEETESEGDANA